MSKIISLSFGLALTGMALTGCSKPTASATPNEVVAFKGDRSKMPANVKAAVEDAMKNTAAKGRPPIQPQTR